jgi:hypothetical protein
MAGIASRPIYLSANSVGASDIGPALQAAFDRTTVVKLKPGSTYLLNSPVFLDNTSRTKKYVLDTNGARIIYGSGLPSASGLSGLAGTKWAFFNNTLRSALSGGTVTTNTGSSATSGSLASAPRFMIVDGELDAQTNIIGLIWGNWAAARLENCVLVNMQAALSWNGYVDNNTAEQCQFTGASPTGSGSQSRLIYQRDSGDGTAIIGCKGFGAVLADLQSCYGFRIDNCVAGQYILSSCHGSLSPGHHETDEVNIPYSVYLDRTDLVMESVRTFASKNATKYSIEIDDTPGDTRATHLTLKDHRDIYYLRPSSPTDSADPARGPALHINALNTNGWVRGSGVRSRIQNGWSASGAGYPEGFYVTSADSSIQSALTAGADLLAGPDWEISRDAAWQVKLPAGQRPRRRHLTAPTLAAAADTTGILGALTNAQSYQYVIACKTASGRYTALSSAQATVAPSTGANLLTITNPSGPCIIAVWRVTGTGVTTAPDHYAEIPCNGASTVFFDFGTRINGRAWQTASLPVPNTVAGTITISNTTDPAGALFSTFDRMPLANTSGALTLGTPQCVLIDHPGGVVTNFNFRTASTGATVTNAWGVIKDLRGTVVAVTSDHSSVATSSNIAWPFTTPTYLPPGIYYVDLLYAGSAAGTIIVSSGAGTNLAGVPPIAVGPSTSTGQTTPPAVGATLGVPTAGNAVVPYIWVT